MTEKNFDVKANPYVGIDFEGIAKEELFKTALRGQAAWKDNLTSGGGAKGNRKPWVNTGEARADITVHPPEPALEILVGGDVVQLWIAEFGRAPNNSLPPRDAIATWVSEKGIAKKGDPDFDGIVYAIQVRIAKDGIKGFAPGLKAANDSVEGMDRRLKLRIDGEVRAAERASRGGGKGDKPPKTRT